MTVPQNVLKSHKSFTYVSPDVFSASYKSLIFNVLQDIVRVSFSALRGIRKVASFRLCAPSGMRRGTFCHVFVPAYVLQHASGHVFKVFVPCGMLTMTALGAQRDFGGKSTAIDNSAVLEMMRNVFIFMACNLSL